MEALTGAPAGRRAARFRDLAALTKPTITLTTLVTCAGGLALSASHPSLPLLVLALAGTGLVVSSANAFNMVLEREVDARMERTRSRPLPAGRLSAAAATATATALGIAGFAVLHAATNPLTAWLALASLIAYAFVYTPLKRHTPYALLVGAVPGATPPLLGWTAGSGRLDAPGVALFTILFLWQLPHFLAIALRCREDYARGGIRAVPVAVGDRRARAQAAIASALLVPASLLLPLLGVAGWLYAGTAIALGAGMLAVSLQGLRAPHPALWDRRLFLASLGYLPVLLAALAIDVRVL